MPTKTRVRIPTTLTMPTVPGNISSGKPHNSNPRLEDFIKKKPPDSALAASPTLRKRKNDSLKQSHRITRSRKTTSDIVHNNEATNPNTSITT